MIQISQSMGEDRKAVSCDEFAAMLGSHSEQSTNSDVFGDWGESVVEVDALFHELTFDHHSCFVLV